MNQSIVHEKLLSSINVGKTSLLTGNNGTGKSRFFELAASRISKEVLSNNSKYSQLVCFSGTHNDKFPRSVWMDKSESGKICYLGYRVANNMISDIAPYRTIVKIILDGRKHVPAFPVDVRSEALDYCLDKLRISPIIKLHLRYGKNRKSDLSRYISSEVSINLREGIYSDELAPLSSYLHDKSLFLQTLSVEKSGQSFSLTDLSSGERAYMVALLGALYCVQPGALILFDEPENSLHPAWQKSILSDFQEVFQRRNISVTTVCATHSPLVASSLPNIYTFTCNFPNQQLWHQSELNGKTSDTALKEQFDIYSSRSPEVLRLVQKILNIISKGDTKSFQLKSLIDELLSYNLNPTKGDPLYNIIRTVIYVRKNSELP